ncbi:MAG: glycosyltransferase family 1 protein [Solirubrobacteraceae bacterium]
MSRVLLVSSNHEDYLADALLHGLRGLLGDRVLDYPKAEHMYSSASPALLARVRGNAFTLYGLLADEPMDRDHVLWRALDHEFELVVFADIWRSFGLWTEWAPQLRRAGVAMAVIDGADRVEPYPFAGVWWRVRPWWFLPRAHNRAHYFKREITPWTRWFASYLMLPPRLGRGLGLRPISFAIPAEKIVDRLPAKDQEFPRQIVDAELAARLGHQTGYAFADEAAYRADLQRSRFGVTTKRAGWDALRHYEIAANGAVPCFRDLHRKPAGCGPHGLDGSNAVSYRDAGDLLAKIAAIDERRYGELQQGALRWARANTTVARARELLDACEIPVAPPSPPNGLSCDV